MSIRTTTIDRPSATNPDRQDVLKEIATKWSKLSKQDLVDMTSDDQLVSEIVKRYDIKKKAARREVAILMDGRNLDR